MEKIINVGENEKKMRKLEKLEKMKNIGENVVDTVVRDNEGIWLCNVFISEANFLFYFQVFTHLIWFF